MRRKTHRCSDSASDGRDNISGPVFSAQWVLSGEAIGSDDGLPSPPTIGGLNRGGVHPASTGSGPLIRLSGRCTGILSRPRSGVPVLFWEGYWQCPCIPPARYRLRGGAKSRPRADGLLTLQRKSNACPQSGAGRLGRLFRTRSKTLGIATAQAYAKVLPCSACLRKRHPLATKWAAEAATPLERATTKLRCSAKDRLIACSRCPQGTQRPWVVSQNQAPIVRICSGNPSLPLIASTGSDPLARKYCHAPRRSGRSAARWPGEVNVI